jgi:hypothetical protein
MSAPTTETVARYLVKRKASAARATEADLPAPRGERRLGGQGMRGSAAGRKGDRG